MDGNMSQKSKTILSDLCSLGWSTAWMLNTTDENMQRLRENGWVVKSPPWRTKSSMSQEWGITQAGRVALNEANK
jgi:hypothetical protein